MSVQQSSPFGELIRKSAGTDSSALETVEVPKACNIYLCGDCDHNLYVIRAGYVKTQTLTREGKSCLLDIHTPGEVIGELCLADSERAETAIAMEPAVVTRIPRGRFITLLAGHGRVVEDFVRHLAERLRERQEAITYLVTLESEPRLAVTLLKLARKLGQRRGVDQIAIEQKITQAELAEMVGTTRSRIGYFMKKFRSAGYVEFAAHHSLIVHEPPLARYVEACT